MTDLYNQIQDKVRSAVQTRLHEMASRWESAIHAQHMDARMSGNVQVADALLRTSVHVVQKSDTEASLEIESDGLSLDELRDDLTFYILDCGKKYAFS